VNQIAFHFLIHVIWFCLILRIVIHLHWWSISSIAPRILLLLILLLTLIMIPISVAITISIAHSLTWRTIAMIFFQALAFNRILVRLDHLFNKTVVNIKIQFALVMIMVHIRNFIFIASEFGQEFISHSKWMYIYLNPLWFCLVVT